jgi:hypothetical protein
VLLMPAFFTDERFFDSIFSPAQRLSAALRLASLRFFLTFATLPERHGRRWVQGTLLPLMAASRWRWRGTRA